MSPEIVNALARAVVNSVGIACPVVVVGVPNNATVASEVSVVSRSVKVMEPLSRNCNGSPVVVSSITAPATSVAVISGVSFVPLMVMVTSSVAVKPLLSVTVTV